MRSLLDKFLAVWSLRRVRRLLSNALALHRRGEVRSDGLPLLDVSIKLTVSWRARDVHPWDRDLPEERAAPRLLDQTLHDTEDAVERIFVAFPEADTLELNVLESDPASNRVLLSGWSCDQIWDAAHHPRLLCVCGCSASITDWRTNVWRRSGRGRCRRLQPAVPTVMTCRAGPSREFGGRPIWQRNREPGGLTANVDRIERLAASQADRCLIRSLQWMLRNL